MTEETDILSPCERNPLPHRRPCACAPTLQEIVDWYRSRRASNLSTESLGRLVREELERLLASHKRTVTIHLLAGELKNPEP